MNGDDTVFDRSWTFEIHHAAGAFLVDGDSCFVTARHTRLVALDTITGALRWAVRVQNPHGWLAVNERAVFYLNQHSHLIAVDRRNGEQIWSRELVGVHGWLHACGDRVVVGGWRGYTDILALDARDGSTSWSRGARMAPLHSTRVHAESGTLVIADPLHDRLVFVRLADGQEVHEHPTTLPGDGCIERPSATRDTEAAIVRCGPHEFVAISGGGPNVRSVSVEPVIESNELSCAGSVVPFLTSTSELVAWHMEEQRLLNLGPIRDRPGGALRFCEVWPGSYVVGTSFGELRSFSRAAGSIASRKIGKRIAHLAVSGTVLLCATDSGEVIGLDRDRTSSPPSASSPRG